MVVIVRWLLQAGKYICVSGSMADMRLLWYGGCCRQISTVVSRVVWYIGSCYCKVVSLGRYI